MELLYLAFICPKKPQFDVLVCEFHLHLRQKIHMGARVRVRGTTCPIMDVTGSPPSNSDDSILQFCLSTHHSELFSA